MMKVNYTYDQCIGYLHNIIRQMQLENFRPDYIVGLTRGGLMPATYISHYLDLPMHTLHISLRDHKHIESKNYMPNDAYNGKKILVIDDINDSGATLQFLKNNWESYYSWGHWEQIIWHKSVKFAVLIDNQASEFDVDYSGCEINKAENPEWCIFPWEQWWSM